MIPLRQSTVATVPMGPFTDVNGDVVTTLTINQADVRLSKNGAAYAQKADVTASAHMEGGRYAVALNATDTGTAGRLRIDINVTGALPVWVECAVLPQAQFDALYATGAGMPAQVTGMDANVLTADALATDAVTEIAAAIVTGGPILNSLLDVAISTRASSAQATTIIGDIAALNDPTAAAISDAVWDELLGGHVVAGSAGEALARVDVAVSTRATQAQILSDATPFAGANVDALLSSRASQVSVDTVGVATAAIQAQTDNLPSAVQRNVALASFEFLMVLSSDHVTGATGLTVTAQRSIDGAAFAAAANAPVEVGNGVYAINLAATDLNGAVITLRFSAATADDRVITLLTKP